MPFFFPLYIYTFQRCHVLLQITRSPTLLFCGCFCRIHEISSLSVQLTATCRSQFFPGSFPAESLTTCLYAGWQLKIEFAGGPPGPPKLFLVAFLLFLLLCSKSTTGADSISCSGFPIQKQAIPAIFHRARTTCPLFSYTEYIASLNFCLLLAYVIAMYSASLASRILTSRPTYAEKLQWDKNLSPRCEPLGN